MASISSIFKSVAPYLSIAASALPGVPVIGVAASVLSKVVGNDIKADPQSVSAAMTDLSMSEQGRIKLKQAENEFKLAMDQMNIDSIEKMEQFSNEDRDSARKREMTVKDKTPMILAFGIVLLAIIVTVYVLAGRGATKDAAAAGMIGMVIGYVFRELGTVFSYYFGSSSGSDRKTELLYQSSPKQ